MLISKIAINNLLLRSLSVAAAGTVLAACAASSGTARSESATPATASAPASAQEHYRLAGLAMRSPTSGYGQFVGMRGALCQAGVGVTSDGGARFSPPVKVVSWPCANNPPARSLAFDNHGDGFLYGPKMYMTHDNGRLWAFSRQPGQVLAIAPSGRSVWMLEAKCPRIAVPAKCPLRLFESANGGRTWAPSASQPPGATMSGYGGVAGEVAAGQTWLLRTGPLSGYVLGSPAVNSKGRPDSAALWWTGDAGASWSARRIPCELDALSVVVSAATDGTLVAVCASEPGTGFQAKSIARSTNGGRSWTRYVPCGGAICGGNPLDFGYLGAIDAVSARMVYLVGSRSPLLVTEDGGVHWHAVKQVTAGTDGGTSLVVFFGRSHGFVLGDDPNDNELPTIWFTSDGGVRWSALHPKIG